MCSRWYAIVQDETRPFAVYVSHSVSQDRAIDDRDTGTAEDRQRLAGLPIQCSRAC